MSNTRVDNNCEFRYTHAGLPENYTVIVRYTDYKWVIDVPGNKGLSAGEAAILTELINEARRAAAYLAS